MKMKRSYLIFVPVFMLQGCIGNPGVDQELMAFVQKGDPSDAAVPPLPKIPEEVVITTHSYEGGKFRSPFEVQAFAQSAVNQTQVDKDNPDDSQMKVPHVDPRRPEKYIPDILEGFELSALKMVGVLKAQGGGKYIALIIADGTVYQVAEGAYIGKQFGRVVKIAEQYIELEEVEFSSATEWRPKQVFVQLETVPLDSGRK